MVVMSEHSAFSDIIHAIRKSRIVSILLPRKENKATEAKLKVGATAVAEATKGGENYELGSAKQPVPEKNSVIVKKANEKGQSLIDVSANPAKMAQHGDKRNSQDIAPENDEMFTTFIDDIKEILKQKDVILPVLCNFLDQCVQLNDCLKVEVTLANFCALHCDIRPRFTRFQLQCTTIVPPGNDVFDGPTPTYKASDFVKHLVSCSETGPFVLLAALLYMERLKAQHPGLFLSSSSMQRLVLVAVMTADKYLEDNACSNADW